MKYFLFLFLAYSSISLAREEASPNLPWKQLFQQLFVWNILEEASSKGFSEEKTKQWVHKSIYYSPEPTEKVYYDIVRQETSRASFEARERLLGDISTLEDVFFQQAERYPLYLRIQNKKAKELLKLLASPHSLRKEPYFSSEIGERVLDEMKDYLFVIIPGFGSHTMEEYSYAEIVEMANAHYGRELRRPREKKGDIIIYEDPKTYYEHPSGSVGFDVLHPMGEELGNSLGANKDVADFLAAWIRSLPSVYKDKKLILLGYSKGSPIAQHVVQQHKDIRDRTRMIITVAGVTQGTSVAQSGLKQLEAVKKNEKTLSAAGMSGFFAMKPLLASLSESAFFAKDQLERWERFMATGDMSKVLSGVEDMTPYACIKWNIEHMNEENFSNIAIFNLSVLTNIKDFLLPGSVSKGKGAELPPQIVATIDPKNPTKLKWEEFSIDNTFLYLSSISGFEEAPGGLFDTQVGWMDTKSMALDFRPLSESLSDEEIQKMEMELDRDIDSYISRREIIYEQTKGIHFVDLGEFRGTHWDLAFRQVYVPDKSISEVHYVHSFPRASFLKALLETLTLYKILNEGE